MAKLTLSVDSAVVLRAKKYAKRRGVSISEMVETYLSAIDRGPGSNPGATPVLNSVRGILKTADPAHYREQYRRHLESKYR